MKYVQVKPLMNKDVDNFINDCNLFTRFEAPVNVIFVNNFIKNIKRFAEIFKKNNMPNNIYFSCKSNKSLTLLREAANNLCGIEVSSEYELDDALKYTNKIISSGPGKTLSYIKKSLDNDCLISVDDIEELKTIILCNSKAKVLLRINDINKNISRFGINISQIKNCIDLILNSKCILYGFSFHINNYNINDRVDAINKVLKIVNKYNLNIRYIDIGGGFPTRYCSKYEYNNFINKLSKEMFFNSKKFTEFYPYYCDISDEKALDYILNAVKSQLGKIEIIIEPGRCLLNNVGISIFEIMYLKTLKNNDNIIVTNGNINCLSEQWFGTDYLIEPKLYKKNYKGKKLKNPILSSIAGNLCLEQDMITWRKILFNYLPEKGDYLIYYNTAGYQMDSNESNFHKIPIIKKKIVKKVGNHYIIEEDM